MKKEEITAKNILIAEFYGWKKKGVNSFSKEIGKNDIFDWRREVKPNVFQTNYGGSFYYDTNWDSILPVFFKFCEVAEPLVNIPRTNISFCIDFIYGLLHENIEVSYKSLIEGIEWYDKFNKNSHQNNN